MLQARGFEILRTNAVDGESARWNLEAALLQSPNKTAEVSFIQKMVRLAEECGGVYDGWGTQV
jgi:regulator of RNase E activity RraB